jgi:hypothetical protein
MFLLRTLFYGAFVYVTDAMQPRELLIEAHIPTHAIVICLWQRRLGSSSAHMSVRCHVDESTVFDFHGSMFHVYMMHVVLCVPACLAESSDTKLTIR